MINIATDFSPFAAGRFISDGPWSGEKFRTEVLKPALMSGKKICVNLDGTLGLGSSFLEEAFGGLVRKEGFDISRLINTLELTSKQKNYIDKAWLYIKEAKPE